MTRPIVQARLLGTFEVVVDGHGLPREAFERPSGIRLLKLLLAWPGHAIHREEAAELLWPEMPPERSASNLRKAVHFARRAVDRAVGRPGDDVIEGVGSTLRIAPGVELDVDVDRLLAAVDRLARRADELPTAGSQETLRSIATLGGLELLPDDPYDEWVVPIRERLRGRLLEGLVGAAHLARRAGERELAFELVERALSLEPADEVAHRVAIELHLDGDHLHAARRQLEACRRAVAAAFGVEPSAELADLVIAGAARRAAAQLAPTAEADIVGRRRELELAEVALDRATRSRSSAVVFRGPAGIGKSRVLRELTKLAAASGWQVLEARGLEATPGTAFAGIGSALAETLGSDGIAMLPEPARSAVLTVAPGAGPEPAIAFASNAALANGLVEALRMAVDTSPVMLAIDDLQWLDHASLELTASALVRLARMRFMVAATYREEPFQPAAGSSTGAGDRAAVDRLLDLETVVVDLAPLGERELALIVERDAPDAKLSDPLMRRIAEVSAGAPLFALEVFRAARARGVVEARRGRWELRPGGELDHVPSGIARLVEDRIAGLDRRSREILATAAELGNDVRYDELVAATVEPADQVLDTMDAALKAGLVLEAGPGYRFAHPLFRASLRGGLPTSQRGRIHLRVARALAGGIDPRDRRAIGGAASGGVDIVAVATHASTAAEAGLLDAQALAVGFGLAAGDRLSRLFDDQGAVKVLRRAIPLWHALPAEERARYPLSPAQIELGQALRRLGDDRAAAAALRAAIGTARDQGELARAYSAAAWLPYEHGRYEEADELLREGLERVTDEIGVATLSSSRGWILGRLGRYGEAEPLLRSSIATLERGTASAALMRALDRLAMAVPSLGSTEAVRLLERALLLADEIGEVREQTTLRMHLAAALRRAGDLDRARDEVGRAVRAARMTGERYLESVCEWIAADIEHAAGRIDDAIEHRRRELAIFAEIGGNPTHEAMAHGHLSHLASLAGDSALAAEEAAAALLIARHSGSRDLVARLEHRLRYGWPLGGEGPGPDDRPSTEDEGNAAGTAVRQAGPRG
ncbi:MAG TPA: AAA family ATPase [Candidatus Deferrimicrobiaceae bacterium]|nr:AAA family ATPase [Candidatus Deferrimicrobiaceae bacterium]